MARDSVLLPVPFGANLMFSLSAVRVCGLVTMLLQWRISNVICLSSLPVIRGLPYPACNMCPHADADT